MLRPTAATLAASFVIASLAYIETHCNLTIATMTDTIMIHRLRRCTIATARATTICVFACAHAIALAFIAVAARIAVETIALVTESVIVIVVFVIDWPR